MISLGYLFEVQINEDYLDKAVDFYVKNFPDVEKVGIQERKRQGVTKKRRNNLLIISKMK